MKDHLAKIASRLEELGAATDSFAAGREAQELLAIIHRPGWTTPAEAQLVLALTEATIAEVKAATETRRSLLRAAKLVGAPTPVGVN